MTFLSMTSSSMFSQGCVCPPLFQSEAIVDRQLKILQGKPTGADTDRLVDLSTSPPWGSIRRQFQSSQDRLLRDSFYSSMSIWNLKKESQYLTGTCTNFLVDSMMAPASAVMMTS
jgi:hypothetical protein